MIFIDFCLEVLKPCARAQDHTLVDSLHRAAKEQRFVWYIVFIFNIMKTNMFKRAFGVIMLTNTTFGVVGI